MPGFNINNFKSHINATGTLNSSKYLVNIVTPPGLLGGNVDNNGATVQNFGRPLSDLITFRGDKIRTPGVALASSNIFRYGIGPSEKKPFNATFSDIGISFIADKNGDLYSFFYSWMNYIFNFSPGSNNNAPNKNTQNSGLASYELTYKNYYASDIEIIIYDDSGENPVQIFRLLKAFPISLSEIDLSWSNRSSLMRLNVNFTYKEWKLDNVNVNAMANVNVPQNTISSNGVLQSLTNTIKPTTSQTNIQTPANTYGAGSTAY